jgi:hypothetical protein
LITVSAEALLAVAASVAAASRLAPAAMMMKRLTSDP